MKRIKIKPLGKLLITILVLATLSPVYHLLTEYGKYAVCNDLILGLLTAGWFWVLAGYIFFLAVVWKEIF